MLIALVGLRTVGTSFGLALRRSGGAIELVGHDPDRQRSGRAKRLGAVDRLDGDVVRACERADVVVIDLPPAGVHQALRVLADTLPSDALVVALGDLLGPLLDEARELLPDSSGFVGGHLVAPELGGEAAEPTAACLRGACFFLSPLERTGAEALDRAAGLAAALGVDPRFTTAREHDGLAAVGSQLPLATAWALLRVATTEAGWQDRQRALGGAYARATSLIQGDRDGLAEMMVANAEPLALWLGELAEALDALRDRLAEGDVAGVEALLAASAEARERWLAGKAKNQPPEIPPITWRDMLLGGLGRRRGAKE